MRLNSQKCLTWLPAAFTAAALLWLVAGCPADTEPGNGGQDRAGAGTAAAKRDVKAPKLSGKPPAAATIAYIGNFKGFQRPCG